MAAGAVDTLKQQITELQSANKEKEKEHADELRRVKHEAIDDKKLVDAGAINAIAMKPFLDAIADSVDEGCLRENGVYSTYLSGAGCFARGDGRSMRFSAMAAVLVLYRRYI